VNSSSTWAVGHNIGASLDFVTLFFALDNYKIDSNGFVGSLEEEVPGKLA